MLSVFDFDSHSVRVLVIDSEPWFVAKDVFQVFGISWKQADSLQSIPDRWKKMTPEIPDSLGRSQSTWILHESAVYKIAFRSNKPEAEKFTDKVADIVATIRKTGSYGNAPVKELTTLEILKIATEAEEGRLAEIAKNNLLTQKIAIDAPYTALGQIIEVAKGDLKVGEYAKIIGTGEKRLFVLLRDRGILSSNASNWNRPYQKYIDQGYFRCTEKVTQVGIKFVSLITPKGQVWLQKQLSNVVAMELA